MNQLEFDLSAPSLKTEGFVTDFSGVMRRQFNRIDDLFTEKQLPLSSLLNEGDIAIDGSLNYLDIFPNTGLILTDYAGRSALALVKKDKIVPITSQYRPCDLQPKNVEQKLALTMLQDPSIDLLTITGESGSGKTFLAIAHAIQQIRTGKIGKIVIAKSLVPVGREVGFLKGDLSEKVRPWLGNFYDNLEALGIAPYEVEAYLDGTSRDGGRIEISPLTFIQGRSIANAVIIVDEAQNLSREVMMQIVTRPAANTKLILLGDTKQIFERGVTSSSNGLSWIVEKGKECDFIAHVHLPQVERSRLAAWASKLNPNED
jgi:PhoH-like ATPase